MEEKAPIIKPEGMTIAKAWLLFLLLLVVYFISGIVAGYMMAKENKVDMTLTMAVVTLVGVIVISAVGLFIIKWELPRFNGLNSTNLLYGITLGIIIRYISSIVEEVPLGLLDMELLHEFAQLDYLLIILPSMGLIFLQIGIIGHGLFKNYSLGIALSTTCLISLINFEPKTVLAMFI